MNPDHCIFIVGVVLIMLVIWLAASMPPGSQTFRKDEL